MNRIEAKMQERQAAGEKAFITYMTAGLPDMQGCMELLKAQEEAGVDVVELGIPFSDPIADGPVIQDASYRSILKGTNLRMVFDAVEQVRNEGCEVPILFMLYYNTVLHYGEEAFVKKCKEIGVDGLIVPDLPYEEQAQLTRYMEDEEGPILIQLVSPISGKRIGKIVEGARGFIYCVSGMGVTGQGGEFYASINEYLQSVKDVAKIPVMMGFGIRTAEDIAPMKSIVDGAIVGSHFIELMEKSGYDCEIAKEYIRSFKAEMNEVSVSV
mgnify:CR=1 FL=1